MSWLEGSRARLRLLFGRGAAEARMTKEIGFHIDMETERLVREQRLDPVEARRRALVAFGGVERHKEALRDGRGRAWFDAFSLDLKLGVRMLVKYPGLTVIGGLAMAFAICAGTVIFQVLALLSFPTLPLPAGDRLVEIRNRDVAASDDEPRALYDFGVWRGTLRSVTDLGAWRDVTRNLIVAADGGVPGAPTVRAGVQDARPVTVAEISASGFRVAGAAPLMGRVLVEADEQTAAPSVAVIGYEVWRTRFGSDPNVLGRSVQLGNEHVTVVGVMREGFEFPVAHDVWMPLRAALLNQAPRSGPDVTVFGLLAPGATLETAQAELTTVGHTAAIEQRATHEHLQPRVQSYAKLFFSPASGDTTGVFLSVYVAALLLVVLVCSNVALLMFARAATRQNELVMRSALGASRRRIVVQMFAEALVLGVVAAAVGLVAADVVLRLWGLQFLESNLGRLPFWYDLRVSPGTVLFALGLTLLGSAIAGVMPALKVTRGMGSRMKQAAAGAGGLQFGGVWTAVIVAQVAVTVAFPAIVYTVQRQAIHIQTFDVGFEDDEFLAVRIEPDTPFGDSTTLDAAGEERRAAFGATLQELRRRVAARPEVAGVTFVGALPREARAERLIELSDDPSVTGSPSAARAQAPAPFREVTIARIEPSYFDVLGAPVLAGRAFTAADLAPGVSVAIVDQGFVDQVLQGRNPIGQQVRFLEDGDEAPATTNPWFEIVGVVKDLGIGTPFRKDRAAGFYLPATPERFTNVHMLMHARGDPMALSPQVREIAAAVDPTLRLSDFQRVDRVLDAPLWVIGLWLRVSMVMTAVALLLSLAGIYAVMSFLVARRTREIGVRVALGASRLGVVRAIFRRPLIQVALGILAGAALIAAGRSTLATQLPGMTDGLTVSGGALILAYAGVMLGVCLLACVVPTRRALGVEPTIALRMD
jgi:putative ABC transport system permease protein